MIADIVRRLNEPFPDRLSLKQSIVRLAWIGLFVSTFLFFIRPLQLHSPASFTSLVCVGYGLVTLVLGCLYELFVRYGLKLQTDVATWTLWKWVALCSGLMIWITLGNFLFLNYLLQWEAFDMPVLAIILRNTLIVGIFPVVFTGVMIQMRAIKQNQHDAREISPEKAASPASKHPRETVFDFTINAETTLSIKSSDLLFVEAMQNYVSLYYLDQSTIKTQLIRNTVTGMEAQTKGSSIFRCHRSYMVNVDKIDQVRGNAQGLRLTLKGASEYELPVSRTYIPRLRALLAH